MDKKQFNERNKDKYNSRKANPQEAEQTAPEVAQNQVDDDVVTAEPDDEEDVCADKEQSPEQQVLELKAALEEEKQRYLYLYAEFDNFRRRTVREKAELIRNGGEAAFKGLLPIIDDFERGIEVVENAGGDAEGLELIYNKFVKYLEQNGVKPFDESDDTFDADRHEAVTAIDVPEEKKGKIIDTVQKGYTIHGDKVLRHAKVVVGK